MYTPKDKTVTVTLTPYMYYNWGEESIRYIEKGNEHPDPWGKLYWGWGLDENGEVGLLPGDYVRQFDKIGNAVTFNVIIPGNQTWGAMNERAYVSKAIKRKVGQLIDQQHVVQLRKMKKKQRSRVAIDTPYQPVMIRTLEQIGRGVGLTGYNLKRFINFGDLWWGGQSADYGYIEEWAGRFARGKEYDFADRERLNLLREVDGVETARGKLINAYIRGGSTRDAAERETAKYYPKARRVKKRITKRKVKR